MYGLIGKFTTQPGRRDDVIGVIRTGTGAMPGCRVYSIVPDPIDPDTIWISEVWENQESHQASLQLAEVQSAIREAMPLITGMESLAKSTVDEDAH